MLAAALPVDVTNDWVDYLTLLVAVVAAVATTAAVLVATQPLRRERRRQPALVLRGSGGKWDRSFNIHAPTADGYQLFPELWLYNAAGKETARDVEVLVTVSLRPMGGILATRKALTFTDPTDRVDSEGRSHVPADFARTVYFLAFGTDASLSWLRGNPHVGRVESQAALLTHPTKFANTIFLPSGEYYALFRVTGSNFDALTFRAKFVLAADRVADKDEVHCAFEWTHLPERYERQRPKARSTLPDEYFTEDRPDMVLGWQDF